MSTSDNDNDENFNNEPVAKKRKKNSSFTKIKYDQKYSKLWEINDHYKNWISTSKKGEFYAFCRACIDDICIKSGKVALDRHLATVKHKDNINSQLKQPTMNSLLMVHQMSQLTKNVKDGEIRLAAYIAEHNIPFTAVEHLPALIKSICPDSEIAKKISCGRTKATAIVKNALGKEAEIILAQQMTRNKFSIIIDEATDTSCTKALVVIVRIAADDWSKIDDNFYALLRVQDASANGLFALIVESLDKHGRSWRNNMIGFGADGASVMMGKHNDAVAALFSKEIANLYVMKCVCHSFALCASKACLKLPRSPEDLTRNIYNYFANSPKRQDLLKEFQEYLQLKPHKMLHPAATRWLSLQQVVIRVNQQWSALKLFFTDAVINDRLTMAQQILDQLNDLLIKMFLEFLEFVLPLFNNLNLLMQSQEPQIFNLYDRVQATLKTFFEFYLKPEAFVGKVMNKVDYKNPRNFLPLETMYFGAKAAAFISNNPSTDPQMIQYFSKRCLEFYIEAVDQILMRIPLEDDVLQRLSFLKPSKIQSTVTLAPLASKFPNIISIDELQSLDTEWRMLRNFDLDFKEVNVMIFWKKLAHLKKGDGSPMFPTVSKFVFAMLTLPQSGAAAERIISQLNNIKNDTRNRLYLDTVSGCLHTKRLIGTNSCFDVPINQSLRSRVNNSIYEKT